MERPSVQAPDTFYPGAVSHNTAAVKKPRGAIFPAFCTFPVEKDLHPARLSGLPLFPQRSGKNTEERLIPHFICDAVHLPGSAPPRFQLSRLCSPSSSWEKKPEFAQKKRHASVQSRINSSAFVRLFLTLGKNTLDYLSRINKSLRLPCPEFASSEVPCLTKGVVSIAPVLPRKRAVLVVTSLRLSIVPFSPTFRRSASGFLNSVNS